MDYILMFLIIMSLKAMDEFIEVNGHNEKQINSAIVKAIKSNKPVLISCKTTIGYGSLTSLGKHLQ